MRDNRFVFFNPILKNPSLNFGAQFIRSFLRPSGTMISWASYLIQDSQGLGNTFLPLSSVPHPGEESPATFGAALLQRALRKPKEALESPSCLLLLMLEAGGPRWHVLHQDAQQQQQLGRCCLRLLQSSSTFCQKLLEIVSWRMIL